MAYADYDFYVNNYGGSIVPESNFDYISERASDFMDAVTFGRLRKNSYSQYADKIKACCCALTESVYKRKISKENVSSEKIGDYSVSYRSENGGSSMKKIALIYLGETGLLFRGNCND